MNTPHISMQPLITIPSKYVLGVLTSQLFFATPVFTCLSMFWPVYWYFDWRFDILRHWVSLTFIMFRITDDDCACFDDTRFYVLTRVLMVWLLVWHFHSHIGLLTGVLTLTFWHCDFSFDFVSRFNVLTRFLTRFIVLTCFDVTTCVLTFQFAFWRFDSRFDVLALDVLASFVLIWDSGRQWWWRHLQKDLVVTRSNSGRVINVRSFLANVIKHL